MQMAIKRTHASRVSTLWQGLHHPRAFFRERADMVKALLDVFNTLFLITAGCAVFVVGIEGVLVPQNFLSGGLIGVTLIINHFVPGLGFGAVYFLLNVPLFILGWLKVSKRFILYTGFGILMLSFMSELLTVPAFELSEPILAAILGGIICGMAGGLVLRSQGSAGGMDILAVHLFVKYSLPMGWTSFLVNSMILTWAAFIFGLEAALYSLVFVYTSSRVMDSVLTGFNKRKSVMIVSEQHDEIARAITNELGRGATFLKGSGAYTGREKKVVFSVITLTELSRMKEMVCRIDPEAFLVVNDTLDVLGANLGRRKEY